MGSLNHATRVIFYFYFYFYFYIYIYSLYKKYRQPAVL